MFIVQAMSFYSTYLENGNFSYVPIKNIADM